MRCGRFLVFCFGLFAALLAGAAVAGAEEAPPQSLFSRALAEAYLNNPDLNAARAELRSVDENYAQAMAGYRPQVSGEVSYTSSHYSGDILDSHADPKDLALSLRQPLYRGGATQASVDQSFNQIKAQRALLQLTEQDVLLAAVTAYMDLRRDGELVRLNLNNENVLRRHLEASRKRFSVGDITKTDVSQAESRLADATARRVRAEGAQRASAGRFARVIGFDPPEVLAVPAERMPLPETLEDALAEAEARNPNIHFADFTHAAAMANTRAVKGELLPQVDLTGSLGRTYDPALRIDDEVNTTNIGVLATIPLYTGGAVDARVRQSRQVESQRRLQRQDAGRSVRQAVVDAWAELSAAEAEMEARQAQIEAAALALEGVRIERDYGSRTTLDLLDAEQEYLDAQVARVTAERDRIVAEYRLQAALGSLTAARLGLPVSVYNPDLNFQKVKNRWMGTSIDE